MQSIENLEGVNVRGVNKNNLRLANDTALIADSEEEEEEKEDLLLLFVARRLTNLTN